MFRVYSNFSGPSNPEFLFIIACFWLAQIDHGHIMELDSSAINSRVLMRGSEGGTSQVALGDLSISQALGLAKDQFMKSLVKPRTAT